MRIDTTSSHRSQKYTTNQQELGEHRPRGTAEAAPRQGRAPPKWSIATQEFGAKRHREDKRKNSEGFCADAQRKRVTTSDQKVRGDQPRHEQEVMSQNGGEAARGESTGHHGCSAELGHFVD